MKIKKIFMVNFALLVSVGFVSCDNKDKAVGYSLEANWLSLLSQK